MSMTLVKGMQSEIFVPITPPMVWTPVTKGLKERGGLLCKLISHWASF